MSPAETLPRVRLETPAALRAAGHGARAQTPADRPFLEALYISVRAPELEPLDWPESAKRAFLTDQFRLQDLHYQQHYRESEFAILVRRGQPIGRLYLFRGAEDFRIVDISLTPEARNGGVGGEWLRSVMAEAAAAGRSVSIHVEQFNPAQTLYRRLGFREIGESGPYLLMEWREGTGSGPATEDAAR